MNIRFKIILSILLLPLFILDASGQGFKLPWDSGTAYRVSRAASPAPTGPNGSMCTSYPYNYTPHNYIAVDFDSPNNVYDAVRASKAGVIHFSGWNGTQNTGYGKLVKIKHADNTITYYAHNETLFLNAGVPVEQGCVIADGGTTGSSTGDHIHFEWRDVGDVAFSDKRYATFQECNCKPKANLCYISGNTNGACGVPCTAPSNDNCSSATNVTSNGSAVNGTVKCAKTSFGANQCSGCDCSSPDDLDVYYKFTAQATSHTVKVYDYSSNFDAVIELRSGCGFGTNIGCYDPSGTPSSVSKTWSGLTVGQTYYVRVYEYDNMGTPPTSPTFKIKVTHVCNKPSTISSVSGSLHVCKAESKTYSVTPVTGATSYTWTLPSGWTGTSTTASINATVGNSGGEITVKANNVCGSSNLKTILVGVNAVPALPSAIVGNSAICSSSSQEEYSISPVTGANSFVWSLPTGWTGSSTSTLISANPNGSGGEISVRAKNACGSGPIRYLTTNSVSIDNTVTVHHSEFISNTLGANYQWIDCATMQPVQGATSRTFTPTANGSYAVRISKNGCIATSDCSELTNLGLSYVDESIHLVAFPNPTRDQITLTASGLNNKKYAVKFTNTQGQILDESSVKPVNGELESQFDIGRFPSGFYFMTISSEGFKHVFRIEKL